MKRRHGVAMIALGSLLLLAGCNLPGKPTAADIVHRPSNNLDPVALYRQNCAGCHGADGKLGPAPPIGDPVYLAIVSDDTLREVISKGRPGTPMSAFAQSEGGMLTSQQVNAIVAGVRQRWGKPDVLQGGTAPSYVARGAGNPQQGMAVFNSYCAGCHGANGAGSDKVGSIVNPQYLSLVTDQGLRTITIIGRPDFNAPDWRNNLPGHPMTDQEITDVVAWLAAQRPAGTVTASAPAANQAAPGQSASLKNVASGTAESRHPAKQEVSGGQQ